MILRTITTSHNLPGPTTTRIALPGHRKYCNGNVEAHVDRDVATGRYRAVRRCACRVVLVAGTWHETYADAEREIR